MKGTLIFDIETHDGDLLFEMPPEEFVRLIGYKWAADDKVTITTDLEELRERIRKARWIIGHNIHAFDLPAVFGVYSDEPFELARQGRVYDTWTHAALVFPAPYKFTNRFGKSALADTPDKMPRWFKLDEQAYQLGVQGKTHDLAALAKEFGNPDLKNKAKTKSGYGRIPIDDERYVEYLRGDVLASERVAKALLSKGPLDDYAKREQRCASILHVIRANGIRVHQERAAARRDELAARRDEIMTWMVEKFDFPTEGKSPWASDAGKEAIFAALAEHDITPEKVKDWPKTDTGNPSLSGDALIGLTEGTPAEDMGRAIAELKGQRSLSQLALDSVYPDGFCHPQISMLQRSGRTSTTEPGLTIWTSKGEGAVEKSYFLADNDQEGLLEIDYSNADARIVAALSGDRQYAKRFEPGQDGHILNAIAAWGEKVVMESEETLKYYRSRAKVPGHGWSYGGQAKTLSRLAGIPLEDAKRFCDGMAAQFHRVVAWQNWVRKLAKKGYVTNEWGRKLHVEKGREFTQAPALLGQNGTREIVFDFLLSLPLKALRRVKAIIHDAVLFSIPRANFEEGRDYLVKKMETSFTPSYKGGQRIAFPVSAGPPGENWQEASHD